jgi:hypothetical protein
MRKLNQLSAAIAVAIGAGALTTAANAVTPGTVPTANRVYISGATATDNAIKTLFLRAGTTSAPAVCRGPTTATAGTIDVYINGADVTKNASTAVLCTLNVAVGSLAVGTNVAIIKESAGGSDRGTVLVAEATAIDTFRSLDDLTGCSAGTTINANTNTSFPNHQQFILHTGCTASQSPAVNAQIGVADVDPQLFNVGTSAITQAQISRLTADPLYQPMFTVAVSLNLYRALQTAQGKALDDTGANIPTLTTGQVRYLFQDLGAQNWGDAVVSSNGTPITDTTYTGGVTVSSQVYVCRRGDESGTQAATAQYFFNERCALSAGAQKFANASNAAFQQLGDAYVRTTSDAFTVFAGKGSGDVRTCLDQHNDINQFAIGLLGSESVYDGANSLGGSAHAADGTNQFRYVAIDGRKPTLEEVANGHYDFVMENVLNRRKSAVNGIPVISGAPLAVYNYIKGAFANVDVIKSLLITGNTHGTTGGLMGGLSGTPNTAPVSTTVLLGNPVSAYTKSPNGTVNNCDPALPVAATPTN